MQLPDTICASERGWFFVVLEDPMDKDEIKGKAKDVAGRVERQVGEWTGDKDAQAEGTAKQAEGKVQNAWGKTKDAVRDAADKLKSDNKTESERDREDKEDVA
jgi:uncharacterized protein YjbJ (UPF0337 family)